MYILNKENKLIPKPETLNNYSTEEGASELKVTSCWGIIVYSVDSSNCIKRFTQVFEGYAYADPNGKVYMSGKFDEVISIEEFIEEYSRLCIVVVNDIREIMSGTY